MTTDGTRSAAPQTAAAAASADANGRELSQARECARSARAPKPVRSERTLPTEGRQAAGWGAARSRQKSAERSVAPLSARSAGGAAGSWGPACGMESAGNGPRADRRNVAAARSAGVKAAAEY